MRAALIFLCILCFGVALFLVCSLSDRSLLVSVMVKPTEACEACTRKKDLLPSDEPRCDVGLLSRIMDSLELALNFSYVSKLDMTINSPLGQCMCADQLQVLLESQSSKHMPKNLSSRIKGLMEMAYKVSSKSLELYLQDVEGDPEAEAAALVARRGMWKLNYPLKKVDRRLQMEPLSCEQIKWNPSLCDECIIGIAKKSQDGPAKCNVPRCWEYLTAPGYKHYPITHEVLYLAEAEMHGCLPESISSSELTVLQDKLCANVLRDAEELTAANYPFYLRDLFLEKVAFCGLFGYVDFLRKDWLEEIIEWQSPSGCFQEDVYNLCMDNVTAPELRWYSRASPEGCFEHMTAAGVVALGVQTRLCAEYIYSNAKDKIKD